MFRKKQREECRDRKLVESERPAVNSVRIPYPETPRSSCEWKNLLGRPSGDDRGLNYGRLPISSLRQDASHCDGCRLLQEALEHCEEILGCPDTIQDVQIVEGRGFAGFCNFSLEHKGHSYRLRSGILDRLRSFQVGNHSFVWTTRIFQKIPADPMREWIAECSDSHEDCWRPSSASLPRRVIDVGHKEAFLYETRGEIRPYATLSHCWQDSQPLKTL